MIYGEIIGHTKYRVVDVMALPDNVRDDLSDACECRNDTAQIINPEYHTSFRQWLADNGHDPTEVFIGWFSW